MVSVFINRIRDHTAMEHGLILIHMKLCSKAREILFFNLIYLLRNLWIKFKLHLYEISLPSAIIKGFGCSYYLHSTFYLKNLIHKRWMLMIWIFEDLYYRTIVFPDNVSLVKELSIVYSEFYRLINLKRQTPNSQWGLKCYSWYIFQSCHI